MALLLSFLLLCVYVCVYQVVNEMYGESLSVELDDLPLHSGQYHMAEFAKKYFREAQRSRRSDTYCQNNVLKRPHFKSLQLYRGKLNGHV